jgi:hypothetical protein
LAGAFLAGTGFAGFFGAGLAAFLTTGLAGALAAFFAAGLVAFDAGFDGFGTAAWPPVCATFFPTGFGAGWRLRRLCGLGDRLLDRDRLDRLGDDRRLRRHGRLRRGAGFGAAAGLAATAAFAPTAGRAAACHPSRLARPPEPWRQSSGLRRRGLSRGAGASALTALSALAGFSTGGGGGAEAAADEHRHRRHGVAGLNLVGKRLRGVTDEVEMDVVADRHVAPQLGDAELVISMIRRAISTVAAGTYSWNGALARLSVPTRPWPPSG